MKKFQKVHTLSSKISSEKVMFGVMNMVTDILNFLRA